MSKSINFKYFIGIDVSKKTLDISVLNFDEVIYYQQITNDERSINSFLTRLKRQHIELSECLFCAEYTGIYNTPLQNVVTKKELNMWVEKAMQIKRSQGMQRGKNDKIDSLRIAQYALKNREELRLWHPLRKELMLLKKLVSSRKRLLSVKKQITQTFTEKDFLSKEELKVLKRSCKHTLSAISKDIKATENQLLEIINGDSELHKLFNIIKSVDGIGMYTAIEVIITTNEFKNISEAKKYACYCGVVPFEYTSGTSLKKKARVSRMANTSVKTLLHMAALSVINMEGDLKQYYERKVKEGKNKMSVINAIRNKLVLRIFSCIRNERMYKKEYNYSLV